MRSPVPHLDIDPFGENFLSDPYSFHGVIRDVASVFWLPAIGAYGIARYAEVKSALEDHQTFCSGRGVGLSDFVKEPPFRPPSLLLEADPPLHDRTRSLMNRVVSRAALRDRRASWQQIADTIGLRKDGRENLLVYAFTVFNAFGPRNTLFEQGQRGAEAAIEWVGQACRRANLRPGGWGKAVFDAVDAGECTEAEAERLVRSFLSAGIDTTVNGLGHMLLAVATHPHAWEQVRANPSLARTVFDESLRWDGTVQTFFRTTTGDAIVAEYVIPKDSKVVLFLAAANRDPRHFASPEQFDPARKNLGHVGFGFGIHQCLGQMVARQEAEVVLNALLARVASFRLTGPVTRRLNNTLHALGSLPIEVTPL